MFITFYDYDDLVFFVFITIIGFVIGYVYGGM